jgi:hypothetical protein
LEVGECIYIDSDMGHAYLAGPGCEGASFMAVCSSAEEGLMETLIGVHKSEPATPGEPPSTAAGSASPKLRRRKK